MAHRPRVTSPTAAGSRQRHVSALDSDVRGGRYLGAMDSDSVTGSVTQCGLHGITGVCTADSRQASPPRHVDVTGPSLQPHAGRHLSVTPPEMRARTPA